MSSAERALDLNEYFDRFAPLLPDFSVEDQHTAIAIYRELASGEPIDESRLAEVLGVGREEVRERRARPGIEAFSYLDADGRIAGFGGLSIELMHHELRLNGRTLWTWCAWDSLFIPELLGAPAHVTSPDPLTKRQIRLMITPEGVADAEPSGPVVSFVRPDSEVLIDSAENVMASFCHHVFFFESRDSGAAWVAEHPHTLLFTLDDAVTLGRRLNRRNFGAALSGPLDSVPRYGA